MMLLRGFPRVLFCLAGPPMGLLRTFRCGTMETVRITEKGTLFDEVERIFLASFPEREQIPVEHLMDPKMRTRLYAVLEDGKTAAMYSVIPAEGMVFLFYLAVGPGGRGNGLGGRILEKICAGTDLPVILNVEEVTEEAPDYEVRRRRRGFYLRHGFADTGKVLLGGQGAFNVLCRGEFDADAYLRLMESLPGNSARYR